MNIYEFVDWDGVIIMKSRIAVCILSFSVALFSLLLGGCTGNGERTINSGSDSTEHSTVNSSDNSIKPNDYEISLTDSNDVSSVPLGDPTMLIGLDSKPIYTSDITEMTDIAGDPITADKLTSDNDGAKVICDGFQYFKRPVGVAYNNYENAELFNGLDYIGEVPENKNEWERVNVGDEICGLKLVKATSKFSISPSSYEVYGSYYRSNATGDPIAEFDGSISVKGFLLASPRTSYEPDGGELRFTPIENCLPIIGEVVTDQTFYLCTVYLTNELICLNEVCTLNVGSPTITYDKIEGLDIGDVVLVRAELGSIEYYGSGIFAELEDVEVLSDVLVHIDDRI